MGDVDWRIWYEGGSSYSNLDGSPFDAPPDGVMVIAVRAPAIGRQLFANRDYYWWDTIESFWFGGDIFGLYDYLRRPGPRKVLFGRMVRNEEYQLCAQLALDDPSLPVKSARHPSEIY